MQSERLSVLLYGLEPALADELTTVLANHSISVISEADNPAHLRDLTGRGVDVIFCSSDRDCREKTLAAVSQARSSTPVVVASSQPEVNDWLDALEAGAADYCAAPFDSRQIGWILDSNVRRERCAAA